jgi:hypothetical protein
MVPEILVLFRLLLAATTSPSREQQADVNTIQGYNWLNVAMTRLSLDGMVQLSVHNNGH